LEDLISSVLSHFKKYQPSGNLKRNNSGMFQGLKFCILMEKVLLISLKLNFTPNTLGCYGLSQGAFDSAKNRKRQRRKRQSS